MTVSTTTNKIIFAGDGANKTFTFPFAMPADASKQAASIGVYFTDASGNISLISSSLYTLVVNAAVSPNPSPVGGVVTYPASGSAIALGTTLTILRTLPETQTTSLANQGSLYQPTVEEMNDLLVMQVQQLQELLGRQITVAVSDPTPTALPPAAQRANLAMGFDSSGNPIAFSTAPAGTISSAMAPFVGAASIAAAKALLGYGTMANENIGAAGKGIFDDGSGNALVVDRLTSVSTNQSITSAKHKTVYIASGALTFTFDAQSTLFNGFEIWVYCASGSVVLTPNAADNFLGLAGGASITIVAGQIGIIRASGSSTWYLGLDKLWGAGGPTVQKFTSGSGTFTTAAGVTRLKVRMVAGGGSGTVSGTAFGNAGTDSSFGSTTAKAGAGGTTSGGAGGSGGVTSTGTEIWRAAGGGGQDGITSTTGTISFRSMGGSTPLAGSSASGGTTPAANSGAGSSGIGTGITGGSTSGGGGGGGEYVEFFVNNPAATYSYVVGAGGLSAGGGGPVGAAGGIIVEQYFGP